MLFGYYQYMLFAVKMYVFKDIHLENLKST